MEEGGRAIRGNDKGVLGTGGRIRYGAYALLAATYARYVRGVRGCTRVRRSSGYECTGARYTPRNILPGTSGNL